MPGIPEYRKVRQYVLDCINQHKDPDVRIASERELAALMNVSRLTVRYALKELIKDKWLIIRKGEGMFINPDQRSFTALSGEKGYKLLLLWGDGSMMTLDGFFISILEHLASVLKYYPVFLENPVFTGGSGRLMEEIELYRPDGIIWVRPPNSIFPCIEEIRKEIPVCILANPAGTPGLAVSLDFREAGKTAAEYFIRNNCRKVAFLGGSTDWIFRREMLLEWKRVLTEAYGDYDESLVALLNNAAWEKDIANLLDRGVDGLFIYGSCYKLLDKVFAGRGKNVPPVRIVTDENYWGAYGAFRAPDAKLILAPPEMSRTAAKELFKAMTGKKYEQKEILFHPSLKEKAVRR